MHALPRSAAARTARAGLLLLLVTGLLIALLRLALPFADLFRSGLETRLAESLGLDVRVGRLELGLAGLDPRIDLLDTELSDPASGRTRLALRRLRIDLDLAASLRRMAPRIESVTLVGARLTVERRVDGGLAIAGLEGLEGEPGDARALDFFLDQGRFLLADSDLYWIDRAAGTAPLHLTAVRARFENAGRSHRLAVFARPFGDSPVGDFGAQLRLVGDLEGESGNPAAWSGELYLDWESDDPAETLAGRLPAGLEIGARSLRWQSWNRVRAGALTESLNRIAVAELGLQMTSAQRETASLRVEGPAGLDGLLHWRRRDDGWRLDTRVAASAGSGSLGGSLGGSPGGSRAAETIHFAAGYGGAWDLAGRIADLRLAAEGGLPAGIDGVAAALAASRGSLAFAAEDLRVEPRELLANPVSLDALGGEVRWGRDAAGTFVLDAPRIAVANADLSARSRAAVAFAAAGPVLDLDIAFGAIALPSLRRYVPAPVVSEELAGWLERAFVGGTIPAGGSLTFRGAVGDFPFDQGQGLFRAAFGLADATLEFNPDWPLLTDLSGDVVFENSGLAIDLAAGRFLASRIEDVAVAIPDLRRAVAVEVAGRAEGPFADDLRVMSETPLRNKLGALARVFAAEGVARTDLEVAIPLRHEGSQGPLVLAGEISWPGPAALAIADSDIIRLTDLAGALRFTEDGIAPSTVAAKLWGEPVSLAIDTDRGTADAPTGAGTNLEPSPGSESGGGAKTRIRASGDYPTSVLAGRFPSPLWALLDGVAPLTLHLDIGSGDLAKTVPPIDFLLSSSLRGLAVALPAPLGKGEAEVRPLALAGRFTPPPIDAGPCGEAAPDPGVGARAECPEGTAAVRPAGEGSPVDTLTLTGSYGDLGMDLRLTGSGEGSGAQGGTGGGDAGLRLTRGAFRFGEPPGSAGRTSGPTSGPTSSPAGDPAGGPAGDPSTEPASQGAGLHLTGSIATLDLPAWIDVWEGLEASAGDAARTGPALRSADLEVERLILDDLALDQVAIGLAREEDRLLLRVAARALAGTVAIPDRPRAEPVRVWLERLDLKALLAPGPADERETAAGPDADPRLAHSMDLAVDRLTWGDNPLGRLAVQTRATEDGLALEALSLSDTLVRIEGEGSWKLIDGEPRTDLSLRIETADLGAVLRTLELTGPFDEAPATLALALGWPGGPDRARVESLRGDVALAMGAGRVLAVEPGVGRVLGVLNLGALQRRLSLDFRDLFEQGYAFDKISGTLAIDDGTATIGNLVIEGPAADIRIAGSADLSHQELAQTVTVTPRIGTGVAIAGAVAGGPLVGAAVLLADQVSGGAVDRLGRYQYSVTGPWDKPEIRRGGQEEAPPPAEAEVPAEPKVEVPALLPDWLKGDGGENLFMDSQ